MLDYSKVTDYSKAANQQVIDLINASNPQLPVPLTLGMVVLGTPTAVTGMGSLNTKITVGFTNSAPYIGSKTLYYRRIDLGSLFKNINPEIRVYSATPTGTPKKLSDLLPSVAAKYGVNISIALGDVVDANFPAGTYTYYASIYSSLLTVTAAANSLIYTGSFGLRWVNAPQDLALMITQTTLDGRKFSGGNDFSGAHTYVPEMFTYSIDFSDVIASVGSSYFGPAYPWGNAGSSANPSHQAIVNKINTLTGKSFTVASGTAGQPWSLFNQISNVRTLPDPVNAPDANSKQFNRCITLDINNAWAVGRFYFHFNV